MTVQELIAQLWLLPQDSNITVRVDCPHGGNSLPANITNVYDIDPRWLGEDGDIVSLIVCKPAEDVEFEVFDAEDSDEDDSPDFGKCPKCGDWCHFPCSNCIARELERGN